MSENCVRDPFLHNKVEGQDGPREFVLHKDFIFGTIKIIILQILVFQPSLNTVTKV